MIAFIEDHCEVHGVERICLVLPIAPSTYYRHCFERRHPDQRSAGARRAKL